MKFSIKIMLIISMFFFPANAPQETIICGSLLIIPTSPQYTQDVDDDIRSSLNIQVSPDDLWISVIISTSESNDILILENNEGSQSLLDLLPAKLFEGKKEGDIINLEYGGKKLQLTLNQPAYHFEYVFDSIMQSEPIQSQYIS